MRPALNPLVLSLKESATLAINLKALELRRQGADIVHFGFGQSPFPVPETIQQALRENTDKKDYLPTQGLPELCEAVAAFYKQDPGNLSVCGALYASEAYYHGIELPQTGQHLLPFSGF